MSVPQQQRCQSAGCLRLAEPDDDEIVGVDAFHLAPGARSTGLIGGIQLLADDALQRAPTGLRKELGTTADHMLAQLQRRSRIDMRRDQSGKDLLSLDQRHERKIKTVVVEEVEGVEQQAMRGAPCQRFLQCSKAADPVLVLDDDLPVDQGLMVGERLEGCSQIAVPVRPVVAVAGE